MRAANSGNETVTDYVADYFPELQRHDIIQPAREKDDIKTRLRNGNGAFVGGDAKDMLASV